MDTYISIPLSFVIEGYNICYIYRYIYFIYRYIYFI